MRQRRQTISRCRKSYVVSVYKDGVLVKEITCAGDATEALVDGLEVQTGYIVKVAAVSPVGRSDRAVLAAQTQEKPSVNPGDNDNKGDNGNQNGGNGNNGNDNDGNDNNGGQNGGNSNNGNNANNGNNSNANNGSNGSNGNNSNGSGNGSSGSNGGSGSGSSNTDNGGSSSGAVKTGGQHPLGAVSGRTSGQRGHRGSRVQKEKSEITKVLLMKI